MKITDETYEKEEREMSAIFQQVGWDEVPFEVNNTRIERIVERAQFENVSKESVDFLFRSFSCVMGSFLAASFGSIKADSKGSYRA